VKSRRNSVHKEKMIRLNKYLADAGVTSRRKADELISMGRVSVNNVKVNELGVKVDPYNDKIFVDGKQIVSLDRHVYIVFNKPKDCITTLHDERGRPTVMDYIKVRERIFPIGRLDRNTTGVLLLTNDGELANGLMHPRSEVKKAYRVTLDEPLSSENAEKLRKGIRLPDGITKTAEIIYIRGGKNKIIGIIIHEGRNRQVHRMFEAIGYAIKKLERVAFADITCEGLSRGGWRYLSNAELTSLRRLAGIDLKRF
jgi:23S rRNA pseudouridine2605 synthase